MKKIIPLLLCSMLLLTSVVHADGISIEISDVLNDIATVSGNAFSGDRVSLLIINPGFTKEDAFNGVDGAVQYFGSCRAQNDRFAADIQITGTAGGKFLVFADTSDGALTGEFTFYNSANKSVGTEELNGAADADGILLLLDKVMTSFALAEHPLYEQGDKGEISKALLEIRNAQIGKKFGSDVAANLVLMKEALVLSAYNTSNEELLINEGMLLYADVLGIDKSEEYKDYTNELSEKGIKLVNTGLIEKEYKSVSEIKERFNSLLYYNVLMNYKESGYGHVQGFFEKYENAYKAAGFDIPESENRTTYTNMLALNVSSLSALADAFNDLGNSKQSSGLGSNTSGGKSSGGSSSAIGYVSPVTTEEQTVEAVGFSDVPESFWAYKAVTSLAGKGILNGYEDNSFRPSGLITRAEFATLLAKAYNFTSASSSFSDVDGKEWFAPYVGALEKAGIVMGDNGQFKPYDNISRQDAALMLFRMLNAEATQDEADFADKEEISPYARGAVAYLSEKKIINGYTDNTFRPTGSITRGETASMIDFLLEKEAVSE